MEMLLSNKEGRAGIMTMIMSTKTCPMVSRILDTKRDCAKLSLMIPT